MIVRNVISLGWSTLSGRFDHHDDGGSIGLT
jgi:hypothetical protein